LRPPSTSSCCRAIRPKGVDLPPITQRPPEWFTRAEVGQLLDVLNEPHRTFVAFSCTVGLRWGEATALRGSEVDWLRGQASVWRVMTRWGLREYPKSKRSRRVVPVPPQLLEGMSRLMAGRDRSELLFAAPDGRPLDGSNFRQRVWSPALRQAQLPYRRPHVMRHTAATWLVAAGVDLYRVQNLLGHEDFRTTMCCAHHAPDVHEAVLAAWQEMDFQDHGARAVHSKTEPHLPWGGGGALTCCVAGGRYRT
jgi:integrase